MGNNVAHARKETAFLKSVAEIIEYEVTNVNIEYTTVTSVRLTADGSHLYVYVTFTNKEKRSLEALINTRGFIRKRLAQSFSMRKVPMLHFELDKTFEYGQNIDEILKKINEIKAESKKEEEEK